MTCSDSYLPKDLNSEFNFMASINPGWLRQNDDFLPYTINSADTTGCGDGTQDCTSRASLPAGSLSGKKNTLAMNYRVVTTAWKKVQFKAGYRQYDYNNDTRPLVLTPVQGDAQSPSGTPAVFSPVESTPFGYDRKTVEAVGEWFFAKKSLVKAGYEGEWMDRSHRDAAHSMENSFLASLDWVPIKDLLFRVSYRHSERKPDNYQDDNASDPTTDLPVPCTDTTNVNFTADQRCHRRFDEAVRLRDRADALLEYDVTDKITVTGFGGTLQDDYNRAGGTNSPTALNFLTGPAATVGNYYLYGLLKDISYNYGFDLDYAILPQVSFFAEYSHEKYHKRMQQVAALVHQYVPPDPQKLQAAQAAGNVALQPAAEGLANLTIKNYVKDGDSLALDFDSAAKKIRSYAVNSYLDNSKDNPVKMDVTFASLPDGTNYAQQTVLDAPAKKIQVKVTNSGYKKAGQ